MKPNSAVIDGLRVTDIGDQVGIDKHVL